MAMEFDQILEHISGLDNGEEMVSGLKERLSKVNNEAKNTRLRAKQAEADLEALRTTKHPIVEALSELGYTEGADIKEFIQAQNSPVKNKESNVVDFEKTPAYIKMQKELQSLREKSEADEQEKNEMRVRESRNKIISSLSKEFSQKIMNGEKILKLLVASSDQFGLDKSQNTIFKLPDGDVATGTKEIMKAYIELHPDEVLNTQHSGTGQPKNQNSEIPNKITNMEQIHSMTAEQIASLTPEQYAQMMVVISKA